jgi:hypothetical protein
MKSIVQPCQLDCPKNSKIRDIEDALNNKVKELLDAKSK